MSSWTRRRRRRTRSRVWGHHLPAQREPGAIKAGMKTRNMYITAPPTTMSDQIDRMK
jgi:hypothetical protein